MEVDTEVEEEEMVDTEVEVETEVARDGKFPTLRDLNSSTTLSKFIRVEGGQIFKQVVGLSGFYREMYAPYLITLCHDPASLFVGLVGSTLL